MSTSPTRSARSERIAALARDQHGLVSISQLQELGLTRQGISSLVASNRLERVLPGVARVNGAPSSWEQDVHASVLSIGSPAATSHRSAAAIWDLDGCPPATIEVVTERWQRPRPRAGVIVHESTDLKAIDVTTRRGIRVTTPVRTLIDLGAVLPERTVEQATDDAIRKRLVTVRQLERRFLEVARRGGTESA